MKSLLVIPLFTGSVIAALALVLAAAGVRVRPADPVYAGAIGALAGIVAVAPIVCFRPADQALAAHMALVGTVLHLLSAAVMGVSLLASNASTTPSRTGFWLMGGYWISLLVTVMELRRLVLVAPVTKAEK